MNEDSCPHTMRIGQHEARIGALESRSFTMEGKINSLTRSAEQDALRVIEEKAGQSGFIKGIRATATLLGYSIIIIALLVAGKFTGALEAIIKFFSAIK